MKQQLFILAGAGRVRFYDPDTTAKEQNYPVPPFASFFEAVWRILNADYAHYLSDRAEITIYYGDFTYNWDRESAASCFEKHWISERELADRLLNVEPAKAQ